jgi:hypothetical protein
VLLIESDKPTTLFRVHQKWTLQENFSEGQDQTVEFSPAFPYLNSNCGFQSSTVDSFEDNELVDVALRHSVGSDLLNGIRPTGRPTSPKEGECSRNTFNIAMCRNIKTLFNFDPPVTEEEIRAASLQFVRKISGFTKPSKANERLFVNAVDEVAGISARLLLSLETNAAPKNREEEAAKAKARAAERFGA